MTASSGREGAAPSGRITVSLERRVAGFLALVPPLVAIVLALATGRILLSMGVALFLAALVLGALGEEAARDLLVTMVRERDDTTPAGVFVQPRYVSALICLGEMGGESVAELLAEVWVGAKFVNGIRIKNDPGEAAA